jgi:hypothetical protein
MSSKLSRLSHACSLSLVLAGGVVLAADPVPTAPTTAPATAPQNNDRFFLSFAQDATVPRSQWWEGDLVFTDASPVDSIIVRGIVAFQPWKHVELGGRFGFGSSDGPTGFPDGTGSTDMDVWGKYHWNPGSGPTELAAGVLVTIPTGDNTAGLGRDAFDIEGFGSVRYSARKLIYAGNIGFRLNGDGEIGNASFSGKTQGWLAAGIIVPMSTEISFIGELSLRSEAIDQGEADHRILGGIDWKPFQRGMLRGAVGFGISDGAPDLEVTVGYAATF